jgi:hypothetical protein
MLTKSLIAAVLALAFFTGCGGGATGGSTSGGPPPVAQCTVALVPGALISPASGATGVPTTVGAVSFSVSDGRMLGGTFELDPVAGGGAVFGTAITGTASAASAGVPTLQPHTAYQARLSANLPGDPCNPRTSLLGTFTTA